MYLIEVNQFPNSYSMFASSPIDVISYNNIWLKWPQSSGFSVELEKSIEHIKYVSFGERNMEFIYWKKNCLQKM